MCFSSNMDEMIQQSKSGKRLISTKLHNHKKNFLSLNSAPFEITFPSSDRLVLVYKQDAFFNSEHNNKTANIY